MQVRNELTFLNLIIHQIEQLNKYYNVNVPLVLLYSFNTDNYTEQIINKYNRLNEEMYAFNKSCKNYLNQLHKTVMMKAI